MTVHDLLEESARWQGQFNNLPTRSPRDSDAVAFVEKVRKEFLESCVQRGQFLPPRSEERRIIAALLLEWQSRLGSFDPSPRHELPAPFDPDAGHVLAVPSPYPGLEPYDAGRQASFFGRDALVEAWSKRLLERGSFLIIGASGSGKSSLALAGIVPHVRSQRPTWAFPAAFTPGARPLDALTAAILPVLTPEAGPGVPLQNPQALAQALRAQPANAVARLRESGLRQPVLLVVDQFEEIFTMCRDDRERQAFGEVLSSLAQEADGGRCCHVLYTLRSDHLGRFDHHDPLKALYRSLSAIGSNELLPELETDDIRRAIEEPAKAAGLRFIPADLPAKLASATAGLSNGLPSLQYALSRLWNNRPRKDGQPLDIINQGMVDALPSVKDALGAEAERLFAAFSDAQKKICERMMLELVLLADDFEEPLRRRRPSDELNKTLEQCFPGQSDDIDQVQRRFIGAGLLRLLGGGTQIEVTHEALLRHWVRIRNVLNGDEAKRRLHAIKQIAREAQEWIAASPDSQRNLLKQGGEPLERALGYRDEHWIADVDSLDYLKACQKRRAEDELAKGQAEKAKKKVRYLSGGLSLVLLAGLCSSGFLFHWERKRAERARTNFEAAVSLSDRLPPQEALDLTYTLARTGGADMRLPLAHSLERMEQTWSVEPRNVSLLPAGAGRALLQLDRSESRIRVHLLDRRFGDGRAETPLRSASIELDSDRLDRLIQAEVGPAIDDHATLQGQHLVILVLRPDANNPGPRIETHLLDPNGPGDIKTRVLSTDTTIRADIGFDRLSPLRFHDNGKRVIFSSHSESPPSSQIFELQITSGESVTSRLVPDPAAPGGCPAGGGSPAPDGACAVVTAVTYAYHDKVKEPVIATGRLNGQVYCGEDPIFPGPGDGPAIRASGERKDGGNRWPNVQVLASLRVGGQEPSILAAVDVAGSVRVGRCAQSAEPGQGPWSGLTANPASLALATVRIPEDPGTDRPLLSFLDPDGRSNCSVRAEDPGKWKRFPCNSAHQSVAFIVLPDGQHQLTIEQPAVGIVRRYPLEGGFDATARENEVRVAGGTRLYWSKAVVPLQANAGSISGQPWRTAGGVVRAADGQRLVDAGLSPNGRRMVWIEEQARKDAADIGGLLAKHSDAKGNATPPTVNLLRSAVLTSTEFDSPAVDSWRKAQTGQTLAAAINDQGKIARVEREEGDGNHATSSEVKTALYIDGRDDAIVQLDRFISPPSCLAFSPSGRQLAFGTLRGSLFRISLDPPSSDGRHTVETLARESDRPDNVSLTAPTSITACAVANDGRVVVGSVEGEVWYYPEGGAKTKPETKPETKPQHLTERTVYRLGGPVHQVSIDEGGRIAALGRWQSGNCTAPGLPGRGFRAWELKQLTADSTVPVAIACFPNEGIGALGHWSSASPADVGGVLEPGPIKPAASVPGIWLANLVPRDGESGMRWHACPGCAREGESIDGALHRLLRHAKGDATKEHSNRLTAAGTATIREPGKGANLLTEGQLKGRYGLEPID